mgnify:FL=1
MVQKFKDYKEVIAHLESEKRKNGNQTLKLKPSEIFSYFDHAYHYFDVMKIIDYVDLSYAMSNANWLIDGFRAFKSYLKFNFRYNGTLDVFSTMRENKLQSSALVLSEVARYATQMMAPIYFARFLNIAITSGSILTMPGLFSISSLVLSRVFDATSKSIVENFREKYVDRFYDKKVKRLEQESFLNYQTVTGKVINRDMIKDSLAKGFTSNFTTVEAVFNLLLLTSSGLFTLYSLRANPHTSIAIHGLNLVSKVIPAVITAGSILAGYLAVFRLRDFVNLMKSFFSAIKLVPGFRRGINFITQAKAMSNLADQDSAALFQAIHEKNRDGIISGAVNILMKNSSILASDKAVVSQELKVLINDPKKKAAIINAIIGNTAVVNLYNVLKIDSLAANYLSKLNMVKDEALEDSDSMSLLGSVLLAVIKPDVAEAQGINLFQELNKLPEGDFKNNIIYLLENKSDFIAVCKKEIPNITKVFEVKNLKSITNVMLEQIDAKSAPNAFKNKKTITKDLNKLIGNIAYVSKVVNFGLTLVARIQGLYVWELMGLYSERRTAASNVAKDTVNAPEAKQLKQTELNSLKIENDSKKLKAIDNKLAFTNFVKKTLRKTADMISSISTIITGIFGIAYGITDAITELARFIVDIYMVQNRQDGQILSERGNSHAKELAEDGEGLKLASIFLELESHRTEAYQAAYKGKAEVMSDAEVKASNGTLIRFNEGFKVGLPKNLTGISIMDQFLEGFGPLVSSVLGSFNPPGKDTFHSKATPLMELKNKIEVKEGDIIIFKGQTGGGKTTLLLTTTMWNIFNGHIKMHPDVPEAFAIVPQKGYKMLNGISMLDFIKVGMKDTAIASHQATDPNKPIDEVLIENLRKEMVWLGLSSKHYFVQKIGSNNTDPLKGDISTNYSGGESVRMLIARMIMQREKVIFLDESLTHLGKMDPDLSAENLYRGFCTLFEVPYNPEHEKTLKEKPNLKKIVKEIWNMHPDKQTQEVKDFLMSRLTPNRNLVQIRLKKYVKDHKAAIISVQHDESYNDFADFATKEWNLRTSKYSADNNISCCTIEEKGLVPNAAPQVAAPQVVPQVSWKEVVEKIDRALIVPVV